MRARSGWFAALLLAVLVCLGGPEPLADISLASAPATGLAASGDQRAGGDTDERPVEAGRPAPGRRRIAAPFASRQARVSAATRSTDSRIVAVMPSGITADRAPHRHRARSPEALQVFRC